MLHETITQASTRTIPRRAGRSRVAPGRALASRAAPAPAEPLDRWAGVAIGDAQVCADVPGGRLCLRVKADVRLQALLPADVRVELVELDATGIPVRCVRRERMFSAAPLHNGTFRYVAELPLPDVAHADLHAWIVRVEPADVLAHAPDARPVERWIGAAYPPPAAAGR